MKDQEFASAAAMSSGGDAPEYQHWMDPSLVKVEVSYPAKYEGAKHIPEGPRWLSREGADMLIEKGIATEVARNEDEQVQEPATVSATAGTSGIQSTASVTLASESDGSKVAAEVAESKESKVVTQERQKPKKA